MAIRFLTAKLGGGKGVVTVTEIIEDELVNGDRCIVTNFAFETEPWVRTLRSFKGVKYQAEMGFRAYLMEKYGGKDFDIRKRLFFLDDDRTKDFYLHCVKDGRLIEVDAKRNDKGQVVSYDVEPAQGGNGVVYIIDEAWKFFASREWQKTEQGLTFYSPQIRKFNDALWIVCQSYKQVDVQLVRMAQEFWHVINRGKMRAFMFRQPAIFDLRIYDRPPESRATPMRNKILRLNPKTVGSCYNTAAGAGMRGSKADIGERKSGIPWWLAPIGAVVLVAALLWGTDKAGKLMSNAFNFYTPPGASTNQVAKTPVVNDRPPVATAVPAVDIASVPVQEKWCNGVVTLNGRRIAMFNDGTMMEGVQAVGADFVVVLGRYYYIRNPSPGEPDTRSFSPEDLSRPVQQPYIPPRYRIESNGKSFIVGPATAR